MEWKKWCALFVFLFPGGFFFCGSLHGQSAFKKYVEEKSVPIRTIDPDSTDYSDLESLGRSIGDRRIVLLGEQDHGDAPTFLAKTRLIKYLHEKKGFNVLAFESDFFALNEGWDRVPKEHPALDSFLRLNIFPIWTACNACQELFYQYIPASGKTARPLVISGFDNQLCMFYTYRHLMAGLDSVLTALQLPVVKTGEYRSEILPLIDSLRKKYTATSSKEFAAKCAAGLRTIREQAAVRLKEDDFWMMVIDNLIAENEEYLIFKHDHAAGGRVRDAQMARNLRWLADHKYAGQKIIVWAHNEHIAKTTGNFPGDKSLNGKGTMGSFFTDDPACGRQTYILGFTSFEGRAGRLGFPTYPLPKPKPGAFERWIDVSYPYAFVDFKGYNGVEQDPFFLSGLSHFGTKGIWTRIFDGVFFIRSMAPCVAVWK